MKALLLIGLLSMAFSAQADVFRCQDTAGKTIYQEAPCEKENLKTVRKIAKPAGEPTPEQIEKAQAESRALVQRYNERKQAERESAVNQEKAGGQDKERAQRETEQPVERKTGGE